MQYYGVYVAGGEGVSVRNNDRRCEKRLHYSRSLPFIFLVIAITLMLCQDRLGTNQDGNKKPIQSKRTNWRACACAFPQGVLQAPPDARVRGSRWRQRQRCRAGTQHGGVAVTRSRVGSGSDVCHKSTSSFPALSFG